MWLGIPKVESLVVARTKSQFEEKTPTIGLGQFLQLIREGNIVIVDMRQPQDYEHSHIKDAVSVHQPGSANTSEQVDNRLKRARNIVLYSSGGVSEEMRQYAKALSKQGIEGTALYSGGFREWIGAGLPVEKETSNLTTNEH